MRVLIVEDEEIMAAALEHGLRRTGYAVDTATDGVTALELARINRYDVILLDRDLPRLHGDEVCNQLVTAENGARILMLTAAGTVQAKVAGFALGADDYLAKPFAFAELLARITALVRRPARGTPPVVHVGDVRIDTSKREITRAGRAIDVTNKEYGVLLELARADGAVLSAEDLFERVWDESADPFSNAVRVTMVGLRKKLGDPPLVQTLRGAGYRFTV